MSTRDEYWPEGTPCWVDLMAPDRTAAEAARDFYGGLFGWEFTAGSPDTGHYTQGLLQGRVVAGLGEALPGGETPPTVWTTYLAVDDVGSTARTVVAAGGQVLLQPMEVMTFGRMAIVADPGGAVFGLWEAGEHRGAGIVNEPGAMIWNEATTPDIEAAKSFYGAVFGHTFSDLGGPDFPYLGLEVDGQTVGGIGQIGADSSGPPPHWLAYFGTADTDDTVARALRLGATVIGEARDSPYGRLATLAGPTGEVFAVIRPALGMEPPPP